jgi:hypothetical protein
LIKKLARTTALLLAVSTFLLIGYGWAQGIAIP